MNFFKNKSSGFTLIELLVVIAIIGVLSSIVIASLNNAKLKTKDSVIKQEMEQLATTMALNMNDYGTYCNLVYPGGWITTSGAGSCDNLLSSGYFSGTYAQNIHDICQKIRDNSPAGGNGGYEVTTNVGSGHSCSNAYSWTALLNDGNWYCAGSSGKSETSAYWNTDVGCSSNP